MKITQYLRNLKQISKKLHSLKRIFGPFFQVSSSCRVGLLAFELRALRAFVMSGSDGLGLFKIAVGLRACGLGRVIASFEKALPDSDFQVVPSLDPHHGKWNVDVMPAKANNNNAGVMNCLLVCTGNREARSVRQVVRPKF